MTRRGFSLLEVILAITILGTALAIIGEIARQGFESTRIARDRTQAQFLCESRMVELASGAAPLEPVQDAPCPEFSDSDRVPWVYSVELDTATETGLVVVRVTVSQDRAEHLRPVEYSLVRWFLDPEFVLAEIEAAERSKAEASSKSSEASSGGSSSGSGGSASGREGGRG